MGRGAGPGPRRRGKTRDRCVWPADQCFNYGEYYWPPSCWCLVPARACAGDWGGLWFGCGDATMGASKGPADTCVLEMQLHLLEFQALQELMLPGCSGAGEVLVVPSTSPCSQDLWSPHGLILHHQWFTPTLQKALRPPSSANKPLQVILLGKPGSYINIHNVNCCNLKAGFPLPGPWVCAAGVAMCAEPLRWEEDAPLGIMVTTGLYCGFGFMR